MMRDLSYAVEPENGSIVKDVSYDGDSGYTVIVLSNNCAVEILQGTMTKTAKEYNLCFKEYENDFCSNVFMLCNSAK